MGIAALAVPLLRGNEALGVFSLVRTRVQAFSADEIALARDVVRGKALIAIQKRRADCTSKRTDRELHESILPDRDR